MNALSILLAATLIAGCSHEDPKAPGSTPTGVPGTHPELPGPTTTGPGPDTDPPPPSAGRLMWEDTVQPLIAERCTSCHLGTRFAYAALERAGAGFTDAETARNYERFIDLVSLDAPHHSRLLAKVLPEGEPEQITHAAGPQIAVGDEVHETLLEWITLEKDERCPDCGLTAPAMYVAYVEQPAIHWALDREPLRSDRGYRTDARILLQPIDPATFSPDGPPIDFLEGAGFCGPDGACDFGPLAASHDGTQLAFECRLSLEGAEWLNDVSWNVCVAGIGADGRAVNPRFLLPEADRHTGWTVARSTPFGLYSTDDPGHAAKGVYDHHFRTRKRSDRTPVFSPDDRWVYLASRGPDPRTGVDASTTYHGFDLVSNLIAVDVQTGERRTIYRNEGGEADLPFFRRNGNVALHTWNLERMDRHMIVQATADGMMELPVLFGAVQGPNQWGRTTELANGLLLGITGQRRAEMENYVPWVADHTLGTGLDGLESYRILDPEVFAQLVEYGFCYEPPGGANCSISRYWQDASGSPDGRAFVAYSPESVFTSTGEGLWLNYAEGHTIEESHLSLAPYLPTALGIGLVDHHGEVEVFVPPPSGTLLRWPAFVGRRAPPRIQPWATDEADDGAELHIADVPIWLSFQTVDGTDKQTLMASLDRIVAVRVLRKLIEDNGGLNDDRPYRHAVNSGIHDHPTHLGINNATGYARIVVPEGQGGDAFGDVPVHADRSVSLRVPAGELLLFQGIDVDGHVVAQHSRVFALPPGHVVDTSVRREQYPAQCAACHGAVDASGYPSVADMAALPAVMDFDTEAAAAGPVDLVGAEEQPMTYLDALRPILDAACVSCHSGGAPAGDLTLASTYSSTANYPPVALEALADPAYLAWVPEAERVRGHDWSVTYDWLLRDDDALAYQGSPWFSGPIASHAPLAGLAPWDPGYQALFVDDGVRFVYLSGFFNANFGRGALLGGNARDSFLVEVLSGRDLDPTRAPGPTDHTAFLTDDEVRAVIAVIDLGFPYMSTCADAMVPTGPNTGSAWCDPTVATP